MQINQSGRDSGIRLDGCSRAATATGRLLIRTSYWKSFYNLPPWIQKSADQYIDADRLPSCIDTSLKIYDAIQRRNILFEGAQGTLLDLDHGTYPYVTPPIL